MKNKNQPGFAWLAKVSDTFCNLMHHTAHQPKLPDASARATRLFWIICLLGWAAMLTVTASSLFVAGFRPFRLVIEMTLALWLPYVALTPLVFLLVRRFPITSASWRSAIFIHLLASIIFVFVCEGVFLCEVSVLGPQVQKSYAENQAADGGETNARPQSNPLFPAQPAPGLPLPSVRLAGVKAAATNHVVTTTAKPAIVGTQSKRTSIDNLYGWRL